MNSLEIIHKACTEANPEIMSKKEKIFESNRNWKKNNKGKVVEQNKRYYKKNRDKILVRNNVYNKNGGNLRRYKITLDEYNQLFKDQFGVCKICGDKETSTLNGKVRKLTVDHDHKTGKVRGLLCNACNRGIGYMRDNSNILEKAVIYLKEYENTFRDN
jgi:hypothetical protein